MMKQSNISTATFNQWIDNGTVQILTLEKAKQLKGKTIIWSFWGYEGNQQVIYEMVVGDIVTSWDYNKKLPMEGYESRTAYWETYMNPYQKQREQEKLILLDEKGEDNNNIYCHSGSENYFDELTFTCSDVDRCVFFCLCDKSFLK